MQKLAYRNSSIASTQVFHRVVENLKDQVRKFDEFFSLFAYLTLHYSKSLVTFLFKNLKS